MPDVGRNQQSVDVNQLAKSKKQRSGSIDQQRESEMMKNQGELVHFKKNDNHFFVKHDNMDVNSMLMKTD